MFTDDEEAFRYSDDIFRFYEEHCTYLPAMLGWFFFSALLSSYNKFVFGSGHMGFPCPLLLTSIHFLIQWLFAHTACALFPISLGLERVKQMSWSEWCLISIPCGVVTAGDVGLSNVSLVFITLSFYTMVKSAAPVFVLAWAYFFGIERITWPLIGVVVVIVIGEFLAVFGETQFDMRGFILCIAATFLSGARWTMVQFKLQDLHPPLKTSILTMRLLAPSMFASMMLISLIVEQPWNKFDSDGFGGSKFLKIVGLGFVGGFFAVAMVLCEFYLILRSNAIVMMIGGVIKELTTILLGISLFGDVLNRVNIFGCIIVFFGVILYKFSFHGDKNNKNGNDLDIDEQLNEHVLGNILYELTAGDDDDDDELLHNTATTTSKSTSTSIPMTTTLESPSSSSSILSTSLHNQLSSSLEMITQPYNDSLPKQDGKEV